jgi:hypothetical protein
VKGGAPWESAAAEPSAGQHPWPPPARQHPAADLAGPTDRDPAIRLLSRPPEAPWWALKLSGAMLERGDGSGSVTYDAEGELQPILIDPLGDPVVAARTPPSGDQRWYVIPDAPDWDNMLGWLVQRALPAHVPAALRRARSPAFRRPRPADRRPRARLWVPVRDRLPDNIHMM